MMLTIITLSVLVTTLNCNKAFDSYKDDGASNLRIIDTAESFLGFAEADSDIETSGDVDVEQSAVVQPSYSSAKTIVSITKAQPNKCYKKCAEFCPEPYPVCIKYDKKFDCKGCLKYQKVCKPQKVCVYPICMEYDRYTYECVKPYCMKYKYNSKCDKICVHHNCYPKKICVKKDTVYPDCKIKCKPVCY